MTKLLLVAGFVLALGTLGFAAANAGSPTAPTVAMVDGHALPIDYD